MARRIPPIRKSDIVLQIEKSANEGKTNQSIIHSYTVNDLLPTGSTLLNLALSDTQSGGWLKGSMANIIGDSSAGKSFVALTTLAEINNDTAFNGYSLIYDDVENANSFNMAYLFGNSFENRLLDSLKYDNNNENSPSDMIEDFQLNLVRALENGSCVYCLDSFDALNAEADEQKSMKMLEAREQGKKSAGTYGMAKAKKSSEILRQIIGRLKYTKSFLSIVSQTRDNINPMSPQKKTRAGGRALKFYATHELWLTNGGAIKSKDRIIGSRCKIKISKNKLTGKIREIEFPIYYDYGIDDVSSCIDFLLKEKHWEGGGNSKITPNGLNIDPCSRSKLIGQIERQQLERQVSKIVSQVWHAIEDDLRLRRKPKYGLRAE